MRHGGDEYGPPFAQADDADHEANDAAQRQNAAEPRHGNGFPDRAQGIPSHVGQASGIQHGRYARERQITFLPLAGRLQSGFRQNIRYGFQKIAGQFVPIQPDTLYPYLPVVGDAARQETFRILTPLGLERGNGEFLVAPRSLEEFHIHLFLSLFLQAFRKKFPGIILHC